MLTPLKSVISDADYTSARGSGAAGRSNDGIGRGAWRGVAGAETIGKKLLRRHAEWVPGYLDKPVLGP